ncbi:hypothetical protein F5879DRAFT_994316 [Lentinula edodes]|nr:hypothetical protein F5879DRAFT_994316 [Lentinula edodes]
MQLPASYPTRLPRGPDIASSDAEFDGKVLEGRERRRNERGSDSDYRTDESSSELSDESDNSEEPSCHCSLSSPQDRDVNTQSTPLTQSHQISNQQVPMTPTAIPLTPSISSTPTPSIPDPSGSHFHATAKRDAATVYAVCSGQEASIYKHRLNSRPNKKDTSKRFPTLARMVTSRDRRIQAKEDDVRRQAKVQADEKRARKKKDKERDDIIRRAAQEKEGTEFEGSLNSKNKTKLEDIAFSLGLDIDATAIVLKIRIDVHFNATPSLKQDPRYMGLFTRKWKHAPVLSENDDIRPSSSWRLLSANPQSPTPSSYFLHHCSHSPPSHYHSPSPLLNSNFPHRQFGSTVNNLISSLSSTHLSNNACPPSSFPHYNLNMSPTPIIPRPRPIPSQPHSSTSTAPHTSSFPHMYIPSYHHPFTSHYDTHLSTYSQPETPSNNT